MTSTVTGTRGTGSQGGGNWTGTGKGRVKVLGEGREVEGAGTDHEALHNN